MTLSIWRAWTPEPAELKELFAGYGVAFDADAMTMSGHFDQVSKVRWRHHDTTKVIVEILIPIGLGVAGNAPYDLLRVQMRALADRIRKHHWEPVEEFLDTEVETRPKDGGYL